MSDRIGALEPGMAADLVVFDSGSLEWSPEVDPVMALVWGTDGRSVRDVFVGGELVVADRHSTRIDEVELRARARAGAREVVRRAGIEVPVRWPVRGASDQT
jgi:5-methylthioadenosine/S-adenosylhomocysteine deaminase